MGNTPAGERDKEGTRKRRVSRTDWNSVTTDDAVLVARLTQKVQTWLSYLGEEVSPGSTGTTFCSGTIHQSSYIQERLLASFGQCTQAVRLLDLFRRTPDAYAGVCI
jgi:hypothetical protein